MATTFEELKRQVFLRLKRTDGMADVAIAEGVNQAHKVIARIKDFDELMVLDTTNAFTVASQKLYHLTTDLLLVRPKDIYTIRYMDEANSRKLEFVHIRQLDTAVPYTEIQGTSRPRWYTQRGMSIELYPIPDEAKPLYILHSQWPDTLVDDSDETPFLYLDDVITTLATEIATSILEGGASSDWTGRAQVLLGMAVLEDRARPDVVFIASPFRPSSRGLSGKYWEDPFVKGDR